MVEEKKLPEPSETVQRLREVFTPLVETLDAEDEPATVYVPAQ